MYQNEDNTYLTVEMIADMISLIFINVHQLIISTIKWTFNNNEY